MEIKTARLTLLIDPSKKAALERLCAQQDRTASQVVRQLIREYLALHGVRYTASGSTEDAPTSLRKAAPKPGAKRPAPGRDPTGRRKA